MKIDVTLHDSEIIETNFQESNPCDVGMEIGTIVTGIDPNYERMTNLPEVNGNTLIGNKTTAELGIRLVGIYNDEHLTMGLS